MGMPAVFANPYASKSQHISSQKIAQLSFKAMNHIYSYKSIPNFNMIVSNYHVIKKLYELLESYTSNAIIERLNGFFNKQEL